MKLAVRLFEGALIGAGAVLPGISGGVLAVLFGLYQPLMLLLSDPAGQMKATMRGLWPVLLGAVAGYVGIARGLGGLLSGPWRYHALAAFVGMTVGMLPSLLAQAGERGRPRSAWMAFAAVLIVSSGLLFMADRTQALITPGFGWNMFCGVALAMSIIVPGMSTSVVLMPLKVETPRHQMIDLYTHTMYAIKQLDLMALSAVVLGATLTILLLSRAVARLMTRHYAAVFHGIVALVIASTAFVGIGLVRDAGAAFGRGHIICFLMGMIVTLVLERFNARIRNTAT